MPNYVIAEPCIGSTSVNGGPTRSSRPTRRCRQLRCPRARPQQSIVAITTPEAASICALWSVTQRLPASYVRSLALLAGVVAITWNAGALVPPIGSNGVSGDAPAFAVMASVADMSATGRAYATNDESVKDLRPVRSMQC